MKTIIASLAVSIAFAQPCLAVSSCDAVKAELRNPAWSNEGNDRDMWNVHRAARHLFFLGAPRTPTDQQCAAVLAKMQAVRAKHEGQK